MARTTPTLVRGVIEVDVSISDLTPFIDFANELVTEICVPLGYTNVRLELIERWLAAHCYAIRDPRRAREEVKGVAETFQYKLGLNLNVTTYGQQVLVLDTKGGFAALNKQAETGRKFPASIGVEYIGTQEEEML